MSLIELNIRFSSPQQFVIKFGDLETGALSFISPFNKKDLEDLRWYIETYAIEYTGEPDDEEAKRIEEKLRILGEALFLAVFNNQQAIDLFNLFQQQKRNHLLTIYSDSPEILALPWELLRQHQKDFLFCQQPLISIRRHCISDKVTPFIIQTKPKLRLLFIISRPEGAGFLNPRLDAQAVMNALEQNNISQIEIEFLRPATLESLKKRLENKELPSIDIIHFDGHGVYEEKEQLGYLLFEARKGGEHLISSEQLNEILEKHHISLMVLSACQSATIGNEALGSVAIGLTHHSVPTVLAMVYSVLVETTRQLFASFYAQLAKGQGIGAALDNARQHLLKQNKRGKKRRGNSEIELILQDWFVPALYQTSNDSALLNTMTGSPLEEDCQSFKTKKNNLPTLQTAGFFGRSWELWKIEQLFVKGTQRITITGFGGQGKTYLVIEAANWFLKTDLFDTVCFVDFSRYQGVDALRYTINELGLLLETTILDENQVLPLLQNKRFLWIWDNLESLAEETLHELLETAIKWSSEKCCFLFTTRQHRFAHESYKKESEYLDLNGLSEYDALAYFNQLWHLSPEHQKPYPQHDELIKLFQKVAFHPLSINLLAQQLKNREIRELGEKLELYLLENKDNYLLSSLKLSLDRLTPQHRELIKQLGVFQGGAFEDDLLSITEIGETTWNDLKVNLERNGLIQVENLGDIEPFYIKFHPILAPALWQQLSLDQQEQVIMRHCHTYYELARFLYFKDDNKPYTVRIIAFRELRNLMHAVNFAIEENKDFVVEFINYVNRFIEYFGFQNDRNILTKYAENLVGKIGSNNWFLAYSNIGEQLFDLGQYQKAIIVFQDMLEKSEQNTDYNNSTILIRLGRCFHAQGNQSKALNYFQQALTILQSLEQSDNIKGLTSVLYTSIADSFRDSGNFKEAKNIYKKALLLDNEINNIRGKETIHLQIATLEMLQGNLDEAKLLYNMVLHTSHTFKEPLLEAEAWHGLGRVYQEKQMWEKAEHACRYSAYLKETQGNLAGAAGVWHNLAIIAEAQEKFASAKSWYYKSLNLFREIDDQKNQVIGLNNLANFLLENQTGYLIEAKQLAKQALQLCKNLNDSSVEIWITYEILAKVFEKQGNISNSQKYRQSSRESYLYFSGMPYEMKPYIESIISIIQIISYSSDTALFEEGVLKLNKELQQFSKDWQHLAKAIKQILDGERNETQLLKPLNYTEAAIVHLILQGIENPQSITFLFSNE